MNNFKNVGSDSDELTFPLLPRQLSSVYSLTLHEFQSSLGAPQKELGSMNMDELLRSIWTADEATALSADAVAAAATSAGASLHRQGSLTLPRTLSQKTVEEVLRDFQNPAPNPNPSTNPNPNPNPSPAMSEMTLEEFLVRAGVVREDTAPQQAAAAAPSDSSNLGFSFGFPGNLGSLGNQKGMGVGNRQMGSGLGGNLGGRVYPEIRMVSPEGVGKGCRESLSPVGYVIGNSGGGGRGRKSGYGGGVVEKVVERRQKRMIKNRESAARSRARKQAYTMELEDEVAKLKEQNQVLQKKQADIMEMQKNEVMEKIKQQRGPKKLCLRRTQTGPW